MRPIYTIRWTDISLGEGTRCWLMHSPGNCVRRFRRWPSVDQTHSRLATAPNERSVAHVPWLRRTDCRVAVCVARVLVAGCGVAGGKYRLSRDILTKPV